MIVICLVSWLIVGSVAAMAFDMFYFDYEHDTVGKKLLLTGMVLA